MATYSTGFCVATTWKPSTARTSPMCGSCRRRSSSAGSSTFCTLSGMRLSSLMNSTRALAHGLRPAGPAKKASSPYPCFQHQRRVEPAGELALRVAVVAVHAHGVAAQVAADGEGDGGLADADRPLEQQVTAGAEHGERRRQLALAPDDAVLLLDLPDGGHGLLLVGRGTPFSPGVRRGARPVYQCPPGPAARRVIEARSARRDGPVGDEVGGGHRGRRYTAS